MVFIDPKSAVYNTIVFYVLIICVILITKPSFMFCNKTQRFKPFGLGNKQTLFSFPVVSMATGVTLYMIFLWISIIYNSFS